MAELYPFQWKENSNEDQETRSKIWTSHISLCVDQMISTPLKVNMPKAFVENNIHKRIWTMKIRPDDIWLVTYPKSGTHMTEELLWQMSTGCNVGSEESKIKLGDRCAFIEREGMTRNCRCNDCTKDTKGMSYKQDSISHAETLKSPRILCTHLPASMLPPDVLKVAKVVIIARNVKDVCVSFYHHEKLLKIHGMDTSISFEIYVKYFMDGKPGLFGDYWTHLKVL